MCTQVGILGGGPAGTLLSHLLHLHGGVGCARRGSTTLHRGRVRCGLPIVVSALRPPDQARSRTAATGEEHEVAYGTRTSESTRRLWSEGIPRARCRFVVASSS